MLHVLLFDDSSIDYCLGFSRCKVKINQVYQLIIFRGYDLLTIILAFLIEDLLNLIYECSRDFFKHSSQYLFEFSLFEVSSSSKKRIHLYRKWEHKPKFLFYPFKYLKRGSLVMITVLYFQLLC